MEILIANVLRIGVIVSLAIVLWGGSIHLAGHHAESVQYSTFLSEDAGLRTIGGIFRLARNWDGRGLIQFGLILLIATPIVRVGIAAAGFAVQKDWLYLSISLIVLAILSYSLIHAT